MAMCDVRVDFPPPPFKPTTAIVLMATPRNATPQLDAYKREAYTTTIKTPIGESRTIDSPI